MILHKVCLQLNSIGAAEDCEKMIKLCDLLGTLSISKPSEGVLEIEFDRNTDLQLAGTQAKTLYECMAPAGARLVGPRCLAADHHGAPQHDRINRHMEFAVLPGYPGGLWRCLQTGCMQTLNFYDAVYMTFRDFSALIHRGSNRPPGPAPSAGVVKVDLLEQVLPDYLKKATYAIAYGMGPEKFARTNNITVPEAAACLERAKNFGLTGLTDFVKTLRPHPEIPISSEDQKRDLERSLDEMHKLDKARLARIQNLELALGNAKDNEKRLEELRRGYEDLTRKLRDSENRLHDPKGLPTAADAMFRFLAGIGFQDRPVADQRKFLELMSELKKELKRVGIGSWD